MSREPLPPSPDAPARGRAVGAISRRRVQGNDLQNALEILWRYKWSILAITLLTVAVALFVSDRQTPIYESKASVLVTPIDLGSELGPEDPNLATEAELIDSVVVAAIVSEDLGISGNPQDLLSDLSIDQPTDTEILEITYRDADPATARRLATGFAQAYLEYRRTTAAQEVAKSAQSLELVLEALTERLSTVRRELARLPDEDPQRGSLEAEEALVQGLILQRQLDRLSLPEDIAVGRVIQPASIPSSPVSPNHVVNGLFGLV
ncbi:MAG: Wzz/FepE/Etk N-terminal domain-containing protein, partial [Actinomycetota bacterium]